VSDGPLHERNDRATESSSFFCQGIFDARRRLCKHLAKDDALVREILQGVRESTGTDPGQSIGQGVEPKARRVSQGDENAKGPLLANQINDAIGAALAWFLTDAKLLHFPPGQLVQYFKLCSIRGPKPILPREVIEMCPCDSCNCGCSCCGKPASP
jgi:hypothetical protein